MWARRTFTLRSPARSPARSARTCCWIWAWSTSSWATLSAASTLQTVNKRALAALNAGLKVILCVGESLEQREEGVTEELVRMQTKIALLGVTAEQMANVVIAYEPVWAIGTGKTATADQAEEVCAQIRKVVGELYGEAVAEATTVQYGGSMNAKNCEELLSKKDVDGGLIGGASLKAPDFAVIVNAATKG